jgi:hypothetical protein
MVSIPVSQHQGGMRRRWSQARTILYGLLLAATLSGCASGPKFSGFKNSIPELNPEQGRIYVYRPSILGAAFRPDILLNGTVIGEMVSRGFFFVDRVPGSYIVSAKTETEASLQITLRANQTQYVKASMTFGVFQPRPDLELVDGTNALDELKDLAYTGSASLGAGAANAPPPASAAAPSGTAGTNIRLEDLEGLLEGKRKGK